MKTEQDPEETVGYLVLWLVGFALWAGLVVGQAGCTFYADDNATPDATVQVADAELAPDAAVPRVCSPARQHRVWLTVWESTCTTPVAPDVFDFTLQPDGEGRWTATAADPQFGGTVHTLGGFCSEDLWTPLDGEGVGGMLHIYRNVHDIGARHVVKSGCETTYIVKWLEL